MPKRTPRTAAIEPISDEAVARIAYIIGDQSAAAAALAEAKARRERGETIQIYRSGSTLLVGPPADLTQDAGRTQT